MNAYDYDNSCRITGNLPGLYHYGVGKHLTVTAEGGGKFSGYDYDEGCLFNMTVSGTSALIYDYGDGNYFRYST
ncbi:hypothetical protein [Kaistia nematophila]|uniref:Uncharacterized protein n=1 Tax=Kaistia nematophila TaxID=2994654 RepID=A0A9X3ILJ8_9HYPH|nr:hypothetical protein [Kaistia nematophila]MCX5569616.1 hypothetical protein [Kaistia nematophila]